MSLRDEPPWPRVTQVVPLPDLHLRVVMDDGHGLTLNLGPLIQRRDAYWRLRQDRYFRQVSLDPLGGICWPEGEDLAPDGLERYLAERHIETHCGKSESVEDLDDVNQPLTSDRRLE